MKVIGDARSTLLVQPLWIRGPNNSCQLHLACSGLGAPPNVFLSICSFLDEKFIQKCYKNDVGGAYAMQCITISLTIK